MHPRPPTTTLTATPLPYTTLLAARADGQLGGNARQHVTVEPGDIAGIVVAVANDANRATEAEREREAIIGREVHRLSRAAGEIVAEIGARGAVACPGIGIIGADGERIDRARSEEHTSELQSLMRISYAVFCLKKKKNQKRAFANH